MERTTVQIVDAKPGNPTLRGELLRKPCQAPAARPGRHAPARPGAFSARLGNRCATASAWPDSGAPLALAAA